MISIMPMTVEEYRKGPEIHYSFWDTSFGKMLIASTAKGICYAAFCDYGDEKAIYELHIRYPSSPIIMKRDDLHAHAFDTISGINNNDTQLVLNIAGSVFQLKVWNALLKIPKGSLASYSRVAAETGCIGGSRSVGTATGRNPVAILIPCHRVIQAGGN